MPKITQRQVSIRAYFWDPSEVLHPSCPLPNLSPSFAKTHPSMLIGGSTQEKGMKLQKEAARSFSL